MTEQELSDVSFDYKGQPGPVLEAEHDFLPVLRGKWGIFPYSISTFEAGSTASARPPSPEPQMIPILGDPSNAGRH